MSKNRCTIRKGKKRYHLKMSLTKEEVIALSNTLRVARNLFPLAVGIAANLNIAFSELEDSCAHEFYENMSRDVKLKIKRAQPFVPYNPPPYVPGFTPYAPEDPSKPTPR